MSKHHRRLQKTLFLNVHEDTLGEHEVCEAFKKLVRNSEYLKTDNFKNLSVLSQIHRFL